MNFRNFFCSMAAFLPVMATADPAQLNGLILKNGTTIKNAKLLDETDTHYIISAPQAPGKSIKVEQQILKSDVAEILEPTEEEIEYKKLERRFIPTNKVNATNFASFKIQAEKFIKKFPKSSNVKTINNQLALGEDVLAHKAKGEIRLNGQWVSKDDQDRLAYHILSQKLLNSIKAKSAANDLRNALNTYDKLVKDYFASEATATAKKLIVSIATQYEKQLKTMEERAKLQSEIVENELKHVSKDELATRKKAAIDQKKTYTDMNIKERQAGQRWTTPNPYDYKDSIAKAQSELSGFIKGLSVASNKDEESLEGKADGIIANFWKAIDENNIELAREAYSNSRSCRLSKEISDPMKAALDKNVAEKRAKDQADRELARQKKAEENAKRAAERKAEREKIEKARQENIRKAKEKQALKSGKTLPDADKTPQVGQNTPEPKSADSSKSAEKPAKDEWR